MSKIFEMSEIRRQGLKYVGLGLQNTEACRKISNKIHKT